MIEPIKVIYSKDFYIVDRIFNSILASRYSTIFIWNVFNPDRVSSLSAVLNNCQTLLRYTKCAFFPTPCDVIARIIVVASVYRLWPPWLEHFFVSFRAWRQLPCNVIVAVLTPRRTSPPKTQSCVSLISCALWLKVFSILFLFDQRVVSLLLTLLLLSLDNCAGRYTHVSSPLWPRCGAFFSFVVDSTHECYTVVNVVHDVQSWNQVNST